ncbi:MAG TPA: hypothetical protein VGI86_03010 [Acidimicrobiia bacterium]
MNDAARPARSTRPNRPARPPHQPGADGAAPNFGRRRLAVGLVALAVVATVAVVVAHHAPSAAHAGTTDPIVRPPHYTVGISTCVFVDHTRSTRDYLTGVVTPERVLRTEIRYPTVAGVKGRAETAGAKPASVGRPFPLVVFAHGYDVTPDTYAALLDSWVRAGMVVAAPIFPDTNAAAVTADHDSSLPEADDVNEPDDVAFVTNALVGASARTSAVCPLLHRLVATAKIALAGQSDGADAVAALGYAAAYAVPTPPLRAVVVLSGSEEPSPTGHVADYRATASSPALLVVQSATDTCNPPQDSTALYNAIVQPNRWFLTIRAGDHLPPYTDSADPQDFAAVASVTTKFLSLELAGTTPGAAFLRLGNATPTIASLKTGAAPVLAPLEQQSEACYAT